MIHPFLVFLVITTASVTCVAQNIVLGVLEENGGHYAGEPNYRTVRVVFEKRNGEWQPFPSECDSPLCLKKLASSYPERINWTIAFDGKKVGQLVTQRPDGYLWYGDVGQQQIIGRDPAPIVGTRSREFGGWSEAMVYRPLVANSKPFYEDPEKWKPIDLSSTMAVDLRKAFRTKFPKLCRYIGDDETKVEAFSYKDEDVNVVKSYESNRGWKVARLHLEAIYCADTEAGFYIDDPWFVVEPDGLVTYLDSGMSLVDAGDYDNEKQSELLFSINRDNEGGYEIFYDSFRKHATFKFSYH